MIIVVDDNIASAAEAFRSFGEVRLMAGREITRAALADVDALIVRSVTSVDRALLEGTPVRFVGTATIGTEHLDLDYLTEAGIAFADAAGAGARSVAEYVVAALLELRGRGVIDVEGDSLGVIGVGAIGSLVSRFGRALGMRVVENDPPRSESDPSFTSASLDDALACDVVVLSVPLVDDGAHPTRCLINAATLTKMSRYGILINVARGAVVDSDALDDALRAEAIGGAVLDVWECEPDMPVGLLDHCAITTAHVAGYSRDGKVRGTAMMVRALAAHFGVEPVWRESLALPAVAGRIDVSDLTGLDAVTAAVRNAYPISRDDLFLRAYFPLPSEERRHGFDQLRKEYRERREFPAWIVAGAGRVIEELGFQIEE